MPQEQDPFVDAQADCGGLELLQITGLPAVLSGACHPAHPAAALAHPAESVQEQLMTLDRLDATGMKKNRRVRRCVQTGADFTADGFSVHGFWCRNGRIKDFRREVAKNRPYCRMRQHAVGQYQVRPCSPGPALQPVPAGKDCMCPKDRRHSSRAHYWGEESMRPAAVANDHVERLLGQQPDESLPRPPDRPRAAYPGFSQGMRHYAGSVQLILQTAFKAKCELRLERRAKITQASERCQQNLNPAEKISCGDMENSTRRFGIETAAHRYALLRRGSRKGVVSPPRTCR